MMKKESVVSLQSPVEQALLLLSVFLLGLAVLVVEILGARVIGPYFGSSVYVWSAQITITLASLAAGYLIGGRLADAYPRRETYFLEILTAGFLVLLVPLVKKAVLSAAISLGIIGGSLASSALLFSPSLIVMSATGPLAIRLVTAEIHFLGRGVGRIYAISTAGSVLGALATGFYIIPRFSVNQIFYATGLFLLLIAAAGFALGKRRGLGASVALAALLTAQPLLKPPSVAATNLLYSGPSLYGDVKVVDIPGDMRLLLLDGVLHGRIHRPSGEGRADYLFFLETLPLMRKDAKKGLLIGLGAGILPESHRRHYGISTDVVEIDPAVVRVARDYFGFIPNGKVAVEDGRTFVERESGLYDFIVLDAFSSERAPFHLFSREFFEKVRSRLTPGGLFALNVIDTSAGPGWISVYKTLNEVFPRVKVFSTLSDPSQLGNLILVGGEGDFSPPQVREARELLQGPLARMRAQELPVPSPESLASARVLTDDFNPIDDVFLSVMMRWRRDVMKVTQDVLLYKE